MAPARSPMTATATATVILIRIVLPPLLTSFLYQHWICGYSSSINRCALSGNRCALSGLHSLRSPFIHGGTSFASGPSLFRSLRFSDLRADRPVDQAVILFVTRELIDRRINPREYAVDRPGFGPRGRVGRREFVTERLRADQREAFDKR